MTLRPPKIGPGSKARLDWITYVAGMMDEGKSPSEIHEELGDLFLWRTLEDYIERATIRRQAKGGD